jgi:hypothetical protein
VKSEFFIGAAKMAMQNKPARRVVSQVNNTTRRYPRTMQEAFGPYTSYEQLESEQDLHKPDRIVIIGCLIAGISLIVMVLMGWIQ